MNSTTDNTGKAGAPARNYKRPTDSQILEGMEPVDWKIHELSLATKVTEEYAHRVFASGNDGCFLNPCSLNSAQVNQVLYMIRHVVDLATDIATANDKAYGREVEA